MSIDVRQRVLCEARLTAVEDLALRYDPIDTTHGLVWGLACRLAELRGCTVAEAFDDLVPVTV